jgi:hypothetical protein
MKEHKWTIFLRKCHLNLISLKLEGLYLIDYYKFMAFNSQIIFLLFFWYQNG